MIRQLTLPCRVENYVLAYFVVLKWRVGMCIMSYVNVYLNNSVME